MDLSSDLFYSKIEPLEEFDSFADASSYQKPPSDWFIIISDVVNSTEAIAQGKCRDVNLVGASTIIAVLNNCNLIEVPFVFGGDGATLLVPQSVVEKLKTVLTEVCKMSEKLFQLKLRVGMISVSEVLSSGFNLGVSKLKLSEKVTQAMFSGNGFVWAEKQIKSELSQSKYLITQSSNDTAVSSTQYDGLECRWQNIRQETGEAHSWLVFARDQNQKINFETYQQIIACFDKIYTSGSSQNPVGKNKLHLTVSPLRILKEVRIRYSGATLFQILKHWIYTYLSTQISRFFFIFKTNTMGVDWSLYEQDVSRNTDFRKFDGMLRMTLSGTKKQREDLENEFKSQFMPRQIAYGLHVSDSVMMTCMVFDRSGRHLHFVDGADGGYAVAAQKLKAMLKEQG